MVELCEKCNTCQRQHVQVWGIPWVQNKHNSAVPCIHICRFQLPNKQWIEYKCHKNLKHVGQCDFQVNKPQLERMARDCQ